MNYPQLYPCNNIGYEVDFLNNSTIRNATIREEWMSAFITTYIEKDLPFYLILNFQQLPCVNCGLCLHLQSSILNAEDLGRSLDITGTTLKRYLDYLEGAFIITQLQPFFINTGKRLVKSPKLYINVTPVFCTFIKY